MPLKSISEEVNIIRGRIEMTDRMRQERDRCRDWTDQAIFDSIKAALQVRTAAGNRSINFSQNMFGDEMQAILAGAILYIDSLSGFEREPESEPTSQERKIEMEL